MHETLNKRQKVFPQLPFELDHHYRKLGHNQVDKNNKPNSNPRNSLNTNANPCATTFIKINLHLITSTSGHVFTCGGVSQNLFRNKHV